MIVCVHQYKGYVWFSLDLLLLQVTKRIRFDLKIYYKKKTDFAIIIAKSVFFYHVLFHLMYFVHKSV
jgi:hypothetical protein